MRQKKLPSFPRKVVQRMIRRGAEGGPVVVLFNKENGKPTRVFGYDEYQKMQNLPKQVKPWKQRKSKAAAPDPLGAIDGKVLRPITRDEIYE